MSGLVVDYESWFEDQQYGPGCYPTLDALIFLGQADQMLYNQNVRFQAETMRVHETVAPTTATAYDITVLSRRVPGYWKMMLSVAKADRAWSVLYGVINTPRSFLCRWRRTKNNLKDLVIKNQRAADQAVAEGEYQEEIGGNYEEDDVGEEYEEYEDQSDDEDEEESSD